jgi:hypothetical protein
MGAMEKIEMTAEICQVLRLRRVIGRFVGGV